MYALDRSKDYTMLQLFKPMSCLSWAPLGGGSRTDVSHILNRTLSKKDLKPLPEIKTDLANFIEEWGAKPKHTVAMVTTASQEFLGSASEENQNGLRVMTIATVGLGNIVAPGEHTAYDEELSQEPTPAGTINIAVCINRNLTDSAALELSSTITVAKAAVMADLNLKSKRNSRLCLATGTDCNIVCWEQDSSITLEYAGLHTRLAELTANTVRSAMLKSLAARLGTKYESENIILTMAKHRFTALS